MILNSISSFSDGLSLPSELIGRAPRRPPCTRAVCAPQRTCPGHRITVATRIPNGVVCLISTLAVHELVTQVPHAVDIAIACAEKPRVDYPPVNVYRFSGKAFTSGLEIRRIDGAQIRVYGPEKSIADAFKYRNKLGALPQ